MKIKVSRWTGSWRKVEDEVVRVTKTMIVVKRGHGEQRFNRKHGYPTQRSDGLCSMSDPHIIPEDLLAFEKELEEEKHND